MFGYRINFDYFNDKIQQVADTALYAKDRVAEIVRQPETKLIAKAAAKSIAGGAAIGIASGVVLGSYPAAAFAVGLGGGGYWGYRCGKELEKELQELQIKKMQEDPEFMQEFMRIAKENADKLSLDMPTKMEEIFINLKNANKLSLDKSTKTEEIFVDLEEALAGD